jgi:NAD+ synthase
MLDDAAYQLFSVIVQSADGMQRKARLTLDAYLGIVAATNFKQRTRKMIEYYYADRHVFAVAGTPNILENNLGFFVKNGDGAADLRPIAHLYKTQVYQLAAYLNLPPEIIRRTPSTDTYPLEQSQEEFYFTLPLEHMDLCLYGLKNGLPASAVAAMIGVSEEQANRLYRAIRTKQKAAQYLHLHL